MFGFWLPGLSRSHSSDWTIEGGHLAERCQLFVIMALGESILLTGETFSKSEHLDSQTVLAFLSAFAGSLAMWWLYFDTSSKDGSHKIAHAADPGRMGAYFHYVHVIIVGGIIVSAVGNELVIAHPHGHVSVQGAAVLLGASLIYLMGNAIYKTVVYGRFPLSHLVGAGLLAVLAVLVPMLDMLVLNLATTAVLLLVAAWDTWGHRNRSSAQHT